MVALYLLFGFANGAQAARGSQVFRILRLVRLIRVARATRLLQNSPELLILAQGVVAGMRSVLAVMSLLMLVIYVFAVVFTMVLAGSAVGAGIFDTVPQSMVTLLLQVLCGADADFMRSLLEAGTVYFLAFFVFLFGSNLTLMNMLIGILCDVVSNVSAAGKEEAFLTEVEKQVERLASEIDSDGSGSISKEEFEFIIKDPRIATSFDELGIDIVGIANFARFIFEQCDEIAFTDFALLVGQFRGCKAATVKDVMDMRRYVTVELLSFESRIAPASSKRLSSIGMPP